MAWVSDKTAPPQERKLTVGVPSATLSRYRAAVTELLARSSFNRSLMAWHLFAASACARGVPSSRTSVHAEEWTPVQRLVHGCYQHLFYCIREEMEAVAPLFPLLHGAWPHAIGMDSSYILYNKKKSTANHYRANSLEITCKTMT